MGLSKEIITRIVIVVSLLLRIGSLSLTRLTLTLLNKGNMVYQFFIYLKIKIINLMKNIIYILLVYVYNMCIVYYNIFADIPLFPPTHSLLPRLRPLTTTPSSSPIHPFFPLSRNQNLDLKFIKKSKLDYSLL